MRGVGLAFAGVQLLFTLTWTVYALFLPALAARAGLDAGAVPFILLADQLVFALADLAMGALADGAGRVRGRLGLAILGLTAVSCAAFLSLPLLSDGATAPLLGLILVWAVSSAALRGPPIALLGKHAARPQRAWLAGLSLVGVGLAGAVGPALTALLRDLDPRLPFALASVSLALATIGIAWAERRLPAEPPAPAPAVLPGAPRPIRGLLAAVALVGLGVQLHAFVNSAPLYLRFADKGRLVLLMPLFWVGFTLLQPLASAAARRLGGHVLVAAGGLAGAGAAWLAASAASLELLVAAQLLAGAAFGAALLGALTAALALGAPGREGRATGAVFAVLALAALARIGLTASGATGAPALAPVLAWAPTAAWAAGGLLAAVLAVTGRRRAPG